MDLRLSKIGLMDSGFFELVVELILVDRLRVLREVRINFQFGFLISTN